MALQVRVLVGSMEDADVLEEALDAYCRQVREDWDGRPPAHVRVACATAWSYRQELVAVLRRAGLR